MPYIYLDVPYTISSCAYRNVDPRIYSCISCIILFGGQLLPHMSVGMYVAALSVTSKKICGSALIFAETRILQVV